MKFFKSGVLIFFLVIYLFAPQLVNAFSFPTIEKVEITQLHKNFEDLVHKYQLIAKIINSANERVEVFWQVNCGKLDRDKGLTVVLTYSGDCSEAIVIAVVLNNNLYGQKLTQQIFLSNQPIIVNVNPKLTPLTPSPAVSPTSILQPTIVLTGNQEESNTGAIAAGLVAVAAVATAAVVLKKNINPPPLPLPKNNESKKEEKDVCSCAHIKVYRAWTTGWLIDQVIPWNVEWHEEEIGIGKLKGLTNDDQIRIKAVWNPTCKYKKNDCRFWIKLYVPHRRIGETKHDLFELNDTFSRPEWEPSTVTVNWKKIEITEAVRGNFKRRSFLPGKGYAKLYSGERLCQTYEFGLKNP